MNHPLPSVIDDKNQWLLDQVNVEFPTKESLIGRDLYQTALTEKQYKMWSGDTSLAPVVDELYLVDFHRLTIMFSILQAKQWPAEQDQAHLIEFFTQIILSDAHQLYVGFHGNTPVTAAIVTDKDESVLISDIVIPPTDNAQFKSSFCQQILTLKENVNLDNLWVEV
ncbi:hypothetical protein BCU68_13155 [Vibrio sp. 10N.286.49.B3]|uniref:hypothetical protein n=1 Tax=Vibrio sp. 10N.286.49.B3 TaxID=1880855 RepID=UPI000C81C014|nr:hypothetical protein [Vibrio sp. 10N.286.49.B3]PMH43790.1 hypothetical protein BCU68_13155 [Vibrio sp. 10N.286.49.B3]